ncbi:sensor histidine kinase [Lysobacter brunescens]|uniref:Sensor histidine kinase n=1 Tax=Lysobacter brunescens TaxID=262323 RepID=A0ABW2YDZ9_9GAMM
MSSFHRRADPSPRRMAVLPAWLPLLAGLPACASLALMVLLELDRPRAAAYGTLYIALCILWMPLLAWLQRRLWRRGIAWWTLALTVFVLTYGMSVVNKGFGFVLGWSMGWKPVSEFRVAGMFEGLESCWLALIAFCATHAVLMYAFELRDEQARHAEARATARDAELRALRYQLQPHFLFNTLNAVSGLVAEARNAEAQAMIARLGDFLRATLDADASHEVALAEELANAEGYLDIERARLGSRLQVKWRIGADVLRARVPTLLLQPLIENAIRHGIAPRLTPGRLEIAIDRVDDRVRIRIENDTGDTAPPVEGSGERIGLRNLAERLHALYPGDHALRAERVAGGGFRVELDLPYRDGAARDGASHAGQSLSAIAEAKP